MHYFFLYKAKVLRAKSMCYSLQKSVTCICITSKVRSKIRRAVLFDKKNKAYICISVNHNVQIVFFINFLNLNTMFSIQACITEFVTVKSFPYKSFDLFPYKVLLLNSAFVIRHFYKNHLLRN